MQEIKAALAILEEVNRDLAWQTLKPGAAQASLVELRERFADGCARFITGLHVDLAGYEHRVLFTMLQDGFLSVREHLASHQRSWTPAAVSADPTGYVRASQQVHGAVARFVEEALRALAGNAEAEAEAEDDLWGFAAA